MLVDMRIWECAWDRIDEFFREAYHPFRQLCRVEFTDGFEVLFFHEDVPTAVLVSLIGIGDTQNPWYP